MLKAIVVADASWKGMTTLRMDKSTKSILCKLRIFLNTSSKLTDVEYRCHDPSTLHLPYTIDFYLFAPNNNINHQCML